MVAMVVVVVRGMRLARIGEVSPRRRLDSLKRGIMAHSALRRGIIVLWVVHQPLLQYSSSSSREDQMNRHRQRSRYQTNHSPMLSYCGTIRPTSYWAVSRWTMRRLGCFLKVLVVSRPIYPCDVKPNVCWILLIPFCMIQTHMFTGIIRYLGRGSGDTTVSV